MKAWNDLVADPDINLWKKKRSEYYIDHGIIIEKSDSGLVTVMSVMGSGDRFRKLTPKQMYFFEEIGWVAGYCRVGIDEFEHRVSNINDRLKTNLMETHKVKQREKRSVYMRRIFNLNTLLQKELEKFKSVNL